MATSIGEEGLDIGEIDVTICYDADKAPTRMVGTFIFTSPNANLPQIQRFGRTGRKRDGTIHALLSEEREELNIEKAEATYREVQRQISRGDMYELYGDVERLIPEHLKPECIEKVVEIQEYVRSKASPRKKAAAALGIKRKRNDDVMRNIPEGASTGFVSVRDLIVKNAPKTKKVKISKNFDADGKDDETDEDIESGRILVPPRRAQSAGTGPSTALTKERGKLRKSSTTRPKASNPRPKKKAAPPTLSQFAKQGKDDPDDMDIGHGAILTHQFEQPSAPQDSDEDERDLLFQKSPPKKRQSRTILSPIPEPIPHKVEPPDAIVELTDSEGGRLSPNPSRHPSPIRQSPTKPSASRDNDMGWLVDDDEDDLRIDIVDSSPLGPKDRHLSLERKQIKDESVPIPRSRLNNRSRNFSPTSQTLVDDSIVEIVEHDLPSKSFKGKTKQQSAPSSSPEVLVLKNVNVPKDIDLPVRQRIARPKVHSPILTLSSSPFSPTKDMDPMPPPALPKGFLAQSSSPTEGIPDPTYPVRPLGYQPKRRRINVDEADSLAMDEPPPPSQPRLYRLESTPAARKEKKKTKRSKPTLLGRNVNLVFDAEAAHSGDDVSEGESNSEDDVESESDRQFIKDSPLTQMMPSYEQTQIYRRSLMTQLETDGAGPAFARPAVRPKGFGRIDGPRMVHYPRRGLPSSSPPPDEELDHYEFGSFVVADDDISYAIDD